MKKRVQCLKRLLVISAFSLSVFSVKGEEAKFTELQSKLKIDNSAVNRRGVMATSYADIIEKVKPAVVSIRVSKRSPFVNKAALENLEEIPPQWRRFFRGGKRGNIPSPMGMGSGIILSKDGYVLTNNHVVSGAGEILVNVHSPRKEYKASLIGADPSTDVAILKIDGKNLPQATLGDSGKARVGDIVLAIGAPFQLEQTVTMGIISAVGRSNVAITEYANFIQTDASINPGNSGGPLVDASGRVIGMNTAIVSQTGGNMGVGFTIPITMALDIVQRLLNEGEVKRALLGVILEFTPPQQGAVAKGVLVSEVGRNTPAHRVGLQAGDVIVAFDEEEFTDPHQLRLYIARLRPGTESELKVYRDGKYRKMKVMLGERPKNASVEQWIPLEE